MIGFRKQTIHMFNRTNKTIVYVLVHLFYPKTTENLPTPMLSDTLPLGRIPDFVAFGRAGRPLEQRGSARPLNFAPGQTFELRLADHYDQIKSTIESDQTLPKQTRLIIHASFIVFDDGMKWRGGGSFGLPDRENPGAWKPLPWDFFPGSPRDNRPPGWKPPETPE